MINTLTYRYELKYLINQGDVLFLRSRFSSFMKRDVHIKSDGVYTVRSLYFDDYENSAYHEKYMGLQNRQKYRFRIYNQADDYIHLERKKKINNYVEKQSVRLMKDEVDKIISGNYTSLDVSTNPLQQIFYYECRSKVLRPRVIVEYEREPFIYEAGDVRITFDYFVRAGMGRLDLFDEKLPMISLLKPGMTIMEVKYTKYLPDLIRDILKPKAADFLALSKFVMGCDTVNQKHSTT